MSYKSYKLPQYPVERDMWDSIAEDKRPKMVYGMGNGADKLFERLSLCGVVPNEVFASDGFVRGHSFRGYKVRSLSEIKKEYDDFIILLSFASNRSEILEMLTNICKTQDFYIPDMPVAGAEYFDKTFYNSHYNEILEAYNSLEDEDSKSAFSAIINYKLFGRMEYLLNCSSEICDIYSLLPENISVAIDAGAYNGDTVRELLSFRSGIQKIYAVEPDVRNYKKLSKYIGENGLESVVSAVNAAAWSSDEVGTFSGSGNRNSSVSSTKSYENRSEQVSLTKIDSLTDAKVDYIKYDVEGAELEALRGSDKVIEGSRPALLISAYHRSEDVFFLVNYIKSRYPWYKLYIRRTPCVPAWEIALIAIP